MTAAPAISVALPCHNVAGYLDAAIASVLGQSFADFELLIVDDRSTDRTPEIVADWAARDPRIRCVASAGQGISLALNACLAAARGEFFARADGDDISLPERFARQVDFLRQNPAANGVSCHLLAIDEQGDPLYPLPGCLDAGALEQQLRTGGATGFAHCAALLRTAAVRAVGGYRPRFDTAEDIDLWLRLLHQAPASLHVLDATLCHYRQHPASTSHARRAEQVRLRQEIVSGPGAPPAPVPAGETVADCHLRWAHRALQSGFRRSARKHAWRAVRLRPRNTAAWWLWLEATLGEAATARMKNAYRRLRGLPIVPPSGRAR